MADIILGGVMTDKTEQLSEALKELKSSFSTICIESCLENGWFRLRIADRK